MKLENFRIFATTLGFCMVGMSSTAFALKPQNITPEELAMLPRYCLDAQSFGYGDAYSNTSPNAPKWVAMMGKSFWHIHHHCWALINVRRAQQARLPREKKIALLQEAHGDFQYVIRNTPEDFVLLPEVITWLGRTYARLGNHAEAAKSFEKARSLKPDYWPPYYHHGEMLLMQGNKAEAREIVRAGLQHAPDAKPMQVLYQDLGGKPGDLPAAPATDKQQ